MGLLTTLLSPQTIGAYLVLTLLAAFLGRHRRIGFWGFFFLSIIVTPFATLFFIFVCTPGKVPAKPKLSRSSKPRVKASV
jgi:hypothetical protein